MKKTLLAAAFFFGMASFANGETNYVCIVDLVTGFHHDESTDTWNEASFLPGERFAITQLRDNAYEVERIDEHRQWTAMCVQRSDEADGSFSCRNGTDELHFNRKELRFTSFRYYGFWNGSNDSLSIAIGRCAVN